MVYRRNKYLTRTALRLVATLLLFYISLHSSREMHFAPKTKSGTWGEGTSIIAFFLTTDNKRRPIPRPIQND
jgi:hypothetical protein